MARTKLSVDELRARVAAAISAAGARSSGPLSSVDTIEQAVFMLMSKGFTAAAIADALSISLASARVHQSRVRARLKLQPVKREKAKPTPVTEIEGREREPSADGGMPIDKLYALTQALDATAAEMQEPAKDKEPDPVFENLGRITAL